MRGSSGGPARLLFDRVPLGVARGALGGGPVRGILFEDEVLLYARGGEELLRVQPRLGPGGRVRLEFSLRDPALLEHCLRRLRGRPRKPQGRERPAKARRTRRPPKALSPARRRWAGIPVGSP